MPRFVAVTNGLVKTTSFVVDSEEECVEAARRCEKCYRVMKRLGSHNYIELPEEERERLCDMEPIDDFEVRRVYKQKRKSPRDFRRDNGSPSHKTRGHYSPPSWR